jgi:5-methylcytosine-specific restriction endonuclease McrA
MSLTARNKKGGPARSFATFEHLIRREQGGTNRAGNIVLAHSKCNARKNVMDQRRMAEERRQQQRESVS